MIFRRHWAWYALFGLVIATGVYALLVWADSGSAPVSEFMHIHGLSVPPWEPDTVYVSTHTGLIAFTSDGVWERISREPHDFMGFQASPSDEGVMYSSGHPAFGSEFPNPVGFMVSRDSGATWETLSLEGEVDFHVSAVQPSDGDVYYGLDVFGGELYRTEDGGESWTRTPSTALARIGSVHSLAVHPDDARTIFAGTNSGLWRSSEAGATWQALVPGVPVTAVASVAGNPGRLVAYVAARDGGLIESTDDGASWTPLGFAALEDDAIGYIALHPVDDATLVLGSFGESIYRSRDGGRTWTTLATSGTVDGHPADHDGGNN